MALNNELVCKIQSYDDKVSNAEISRQLGVHKETVAKYRKKKAEETASLLSGNEEQMRLKEKLKDGTVAPLPPENLPTKEEQKKLDLLQHYSPKDIKELLNFVAMNSKHEVNEETGEPGHLKVGIVSDTHLGAKGCDLEALQNFYDRAKERGAECFVHAGDMVDGTGVYGGQQFEQSDVGFEDQVKRVVESYPNVGLKTYFIGGNHSESYLKGGGADITKTIAGLRDDLVNLGFYNGKLNINGITIELQHGGGGSSYSKDYKLQRYMDKIPAGEEPDIYVLGHYHTAIHSLHRGIHGFMPASFLKENLLAKRFGLGNVIGGWLVEITKDPDGKKELTATFIGY